MKTFAVDAIRILLVIDITNIYRGPAGCKVKDRIGEAVGWCRKAAETAPQNPAYAYTLAFYLNQKGDTDEAVRTLEALRRNTPGTGTPRCCSGS
jgi:hypothetical protein